MASNIMTDKLGKTMVTAADVLEYLKTHPEFLADNPELMDILTLPKAKQEKGIVDFQHFMVKRLKDQQVKTQAQQKTIIKNARANESVRTRINTAVIRLLDARSLEEFVEALTSELPLYLDVDVVTLVVEALGSDRDLPHGYVSGVQIVPEGTISAIMGDEHISLRGSTDQDNMLFGPGAGLVRSQAVLKLFIGPETPLGAVAFGSRDPDGFHEKQGTELVSFLAAVIERSLRRWLDVPVS